MLKSFLDVPQNRTAPMNQEKTEMYVKLVMLDQSGYRSFVEHFQQHPNDLESIGFLANVLFERLKSHKVEVSLPVGLFVTLNSTTPGEIVLWAYTLHCLQKKNGRPVGMAELSEAFPVGFPVEDAVHDIWDNQKGFVHNVQVDNMLDHAEYWQ